MELWNRDRKDAAAVVKNSSFFMVNNTFTLYISSLHPNYFKVVYFR